MATPGDDARAARHVLDVLAIQQVQNRYAVAIDERRWDLLASCFTEQVDLDYGHAGHYFELGDFVRWAKQFHEPLGRTLHRMSSHYAEVSEDVAIASCYGHAILTRFPDGIPDQHSYSRYSDRLTRTPEGWKIATRTLVPVLREASRRG